MHERSPLQIVEEAKKAQVAFDEKREQEENAARSREMAAHAEMDYQDHIRDQQMYANHEEKENFGMFEDLQQNEIQAMDEYEHAKTLYIQAEQALDEFIFESDKALFDGTTHPRVYDDDETPANSGETPTSRFFNDQIQRLRHEVSQRRHILQQAERRLHAYREKLSQIIDLEKENVYAQSEIALAQENAREADENLAKFESSIAHYSGDESIIIDEHVQNAINRRLLELQNERSKRYMMLEQARQRYSDVQGVMAVDLNQSGNVPGTETSNGRARLERVLHKVSEKRDRELGQEWDTALVKEKELQLVQEESRAALNELRRIEGQYQMSTKQVAPEIAQAIVNLEARLLSVDKDLKEITVQKERLKQDPDIIRILQAREVSKREEELKAEKLDKQHEKNTAEHEKAIEGTREHLGMLEGRISEAGKRLVELWQNDGGWMLITPEEEGQYLNNYILHKRSKEIEIRRLEKQIQEKEVELAAKSHTFFGFGKARIRNELEGLVGKLEGVRQEFESDERFRERLERASEKLQDHIIHDVAEYARTMRHLDQMQSEVGNTRFKPIADTIKDKFPFMRENPGSVHGYEVGSVTKLLKHHGFERSKSPEKGK